MVLLSHATKDRVEMDAVMALSKDALYKLFCQRTFRRAHAAILVLCGWSLARSGASTSSLRLVLDILEEEQRLLMLMLEQPQTILEIRAKAPIWNEVLMAATKGPKANTPVLLRLLRAGIEYPYFKLEIYGLVIREKDYFLLDLLDRKAAGKILRGIRATTEEKLDVVSSNANKPPILTSMDDSEAVMLDVADVSQSNDVLRQLQRTRAIEFLKDHKSGRDTDQRQELYSESGLLALTDTGHTKHFVWDGDVKPTSSETRKICLGMSELDAVETEIGHEARAPQCHDTDSYPVKAEKTKQQQDQIISQFALAAFRNLRVADQLFQIDAWDTPSFHSPIQATL